jgi:hypothetical protein
MFDWGGWVRWPYRSKFLYLFVVHPREKSQYRIDKMAEEDNCKILAPKQLNLFDL